MRPHYPVRVSPQSILDMREDRTKTERAEQQIAEILQRLQSSDPGPAWSSFLDRYAQLIMNGINQFEYHQDRIDECFIFVCEQLNDDGFRRLLKFNTQGKASFRTWLTAVVFNLCVDWHRREFGRVRLVPAVAALPAFDQKVYRLVIEQGVGKEEAYQLLKPDFPDLTRDMLVDAAARVFSLLTPRQRWRISIRARGRSPTRPGAAGESFEQVPDPGAGPESEARAREELGELDRAMAQLPREQRLLLHLRFQEGLGLKKIAELQNLGDSNRAWRQIQAATRALSALLQHLKKGRKRKN